MILLENHTFTYVVGKFPACKLSNSMNLVNDRHTSMCVDRKRNSYLTALQPPDPDHALFTLAVLMLNGERTSIHAAHALKSVRHSTSS